MQFVSLRRWIRNRAVARSPLLLRVPPELQDPVGKRFCVSREHRFCYFRVPKAANSTVANSLAAAVYGQHGLDDKGDVAKSAFDDITAVSKHTEAQLLEEFFCFTVVRHPLSRVLSAYLSKIDKKSSQIRDKAGLAKGTTFSEFIDYLRYGGLNSDPHWAPQVNLIPINSEKLHFVGRVETLEEDFSKLSTMLFGEAKSLISRESSRTSANNKVSASYSENERKVVTEMYADDIRQFYA